MVRISPDVRIIQHSITTFGPWRPLASGDTPPDLASYPQAVPGSGDTAGRRVCLRLPHSLTDGILCVGATEVSATQGATPHSPYRNEMGVRTADEVDSAAVGAS